MKNDQIIYGDNLTLVMTPNEIRQLFGMRPIEKMVRNLPTNCPNCGAPLKSSKCEYCDTIFNQR